MKQKIEGIFKSFSSSTIRLKKHKKNEEKFKQSSMKLQKNF